MKTSALSVMASQQATADREALVAALSETRQAQQQLEQQRGAIERTRTAMHAQKKLVLAAEENIAKAQEDYACALANAATSDTAAPTGGVQAARQAVLEANDKMEALKSALTQFRADLPAYESVVRQANMAVEQAISAILLPCVLRLLDMASRVRDQMRPLRKALILFITEPSGSGHSTEIRQEIATFLSTIWRDDDEACDNPWSIRARLRADPYTPLPDPSSWTKINKGESE